MARSPGSAKHEQVLVRLTTEQALWLSAIEYVDEVSVAELIRRLVDAEVAQRRGDPFVAEAAEVRLRARARADGELTPLGRQCGVGS